MRKRLPKLHSKKVLIGIVCALVLGLVGYNVRDILFGTPLRVSVAKDGATLDDVFLPLSGSAGHAREILINGRMVATDRNGKFSDAIILSPGYNIVEVALKDRFGNTDTRTYHWVVQPSTSLAQAPSTTY